MQPDYNLLKLKFYSTVIADILKAIDGGSFGGAFILSFCCIDYLGKPLSILAAKNKNDKNDYKYFIKNYMGKVNNRYIDLVDHFYAIRCSLVHTYGESDASRNSNIEPQFLFGDFLNYHLTFDNNNKKINISLSDFVSELISALYLFFTNLSLLTNEWSLQLYYPQDLKGLTGRNLIKLGDQINYGTIHPFLEILNTSDDISQICVDIKNKVEEQINKH